MARGAIFFCLLLGCSQADVVGLVPAGTGSGSGSVGTEGSGSGSSSTSSGSAGSTVTGAPTGTGASSSSGTSSGGTGSTGTGTTGVVAGCSAVDLLVVVDSGLGQADVVNRLQTAVPDLMEGLWQALPPDTDLHVAMTLSDFSDGMGCARTVIDCVIQQTPQEIEALYLEPSGTTTTVAGGQGRLYEHEGMRWFPTTTADSPTPATVWLANAVQSLGNGCPMSMPSAALGWAMDPVNAATNDGFLRDDAILAVVVVTEGPDATPAEAPALVAKVDMAKAACPDCVVVAGLLGPCVTGYAEKLWEMILSLDPNPVVGSAASQGDFTTVLGQGFPLAVADACASINPRG